ncbi:DUF3375 domain-containing protein [Subtercola endophyticus]|uniref:DUF3375 domain-containing protein n=1 Tax=Subtercola endophyticus TaxID=2895559 RepID=UPI001E4B36A5|nr:DUF3375 domain-containing protein [Subtercola endophyticus]UFS57575.1 DUF3375 domain-containing protein [Subtercola endophyticus]
MAASSLARTLELERLQEESITWRLLQKDNAPLIAGTLGHHFGADQRRLPAEELYELLDADLDELRDFGSVLPKSAQGYCADWRNAGFLVRRAAENIRGETLELSAGALAAIRTLDELSTPRQSATESRLASIASQLRQLAIDTDPDVSRRLEQLYEQRDRIDAQIERIHADDNPVLETPRAAERVRDILAQASEIPADFARVRAEFEELNQLLRQRIVESDHAQRIVLDEVFSGVDHIAESDEGRTFTAFNALVMDPALGAEFDANVDQLLERDFVNVLSVEQRRFLRRFQSTLKSDSGEIHNVVATFARGLRRYVQSQEFQQDRVLRQELQVALGLGLEAASSTKPYSSTDVSLSLSSVEIRSVGAVQLHNPADFDADEVIVTNVNTIVDLAALRALARDTEIDFAELISNTNAVLADSPTATVAHVLKRFPATQGVASVVGLIALAESQGTRLEKEELVRWINRNGQSRHALIPAHVFAGRVV